MRSATYSSLVTLVFLKNRDKISRSIESAIRSTDRLCEDLGMENDLSHMTKYRIISELLQSKILIERKTNKNRKVRFSKKISNIF